MLLGTGKTIITPPLGTPLAGFGFRDHGAESVRDDLEVRVLWLRASATPGEEACLVTADLIGFGAQMTERIRAEVRRRFNLGEERLLLSASHTHSGPQTQESMVATGELVPSVVADIEARIYAAIEAARAELHPVTLHVGTGECAGYAINRRKQQEDGYFLNAPNPDGIRDDTVTVLSFQDVQSQTVRAVLFHFACHPTTMGDYAITGDYPGVARRHIEEALGGEAIAAFLPGCFGDVRPNCALIGGKRFRKGVADDLATFGRALGGEVVRLLKTELKSVPSRLYGKTGEVELALQGHPEREKLLRLSESGSPLEKQWAAKLLAVPFSEQRALTLQRLDLAEGVTLIALGGEICCSFGFHIRKMQANTCLLPLGYSNGLLGYICPEVMYREGGYEPDESTVYYGLPSPFQPDSEKRVLAAVEALLQTNVHGSSTTATQSISN